MFSSILVEKDLLSMPRAKSILSHFPAAEIFPIDLYENYFGNRKKPYLHKRNQKTLILAQKKGELIKKAPPAYGKGFSEHYYFVHAYNCIYECQYCYLQGHFDSPDLVWFLNWEDIFKEMQETIDQDADKSIWFHAGEFSDSLALAHISGEIPELFQFFERQRPGVFLELRTKSVNIRPLLQLDYPLPNICVSFTLGPEGLHREIELGVPSVRSRIMAMAKLQERGYRLALHLDPIVFHENWEEDYHRLWGDLKESINLRALAYVSLGVVRFPEKVYREVQKNYPDSLLFKQEFVTGQDGKKKIPRPLRMSYLSKIKKMALAQGVSEDAIYICMEETLDHQTLCL